MEKECPPEFLRGVETKDYIRHGFPTASALKFFENTDRIDDHVEASINWYDDEGAISELLNRKKVNGEIKFQYGYIKMSTQMFKDLRKLPLFFDNKVDLRYERDSLEDNEYHGNLLINKGIHEKNMTNICSVIALNCCIKCVTRDLEQEEPEMFNT